MLSVSWIYLVSDMLGCYTDATLPNDDCRHCGCPKCLLFDFRCSFRVGQPRPCMSSRGGWRLGRDEVRGLGMVPRCIPRHGGCVCVWSGGVPREAALGEVLSLEASALCAVIPLPSPPSATPGEGLSHHGRAGLRDVPLGLQLFDLLLPCKLLTPLPPPPPPFKILAVTL